MKVIITAIKGRDTNNTTSDWPHIMVDVCLVGGPVKTFLSVITVIQPKKLKGTRMESLSLRVEVFPCSKTTVLVPLRNKIPVTN